ncbi:MAG TPA: hypothetical protein VD768_02870 [Sphingomicrobium sp.]|nr:hypothetical protein [Sphingomicrobium sp.]
MRKTILALALGALAFASPASATGGLVCRTSGLAPIEVAVGFGHVPGAPLIARRLVDGGRIIPAEDAQWWLDNKEMRLILVAPQAQREEVVIRAKRNGHNYDGSLRRDGKRRWVRCREG